MKTWLAIDKDFSTRKAAENFAEKSRSSNQPCEYQVREVNPVWFTVLMRSDSADSGDGFTLAGETASETSDRRSSEVAGFDIGTGFGIKGLDW